MSRKYRFEIKYLINTRDAEILKQRLSMIMQPDKNGINGYFIRSLYFDTPDNLYYHEKMAGVEYRKKYRIRLYNKEDNYISLEKKCKDNYMTYKKQARLDRDLVNKILNNNISLDECDNELLKEFAVAIKTNGLKPSVIVDYDRYALTYPVSDVRITFDSNIKSGMYNYDIFNYDNHVCHVLDKDVIVLEVKYNEILPEAISIILETIPLARSSFSKFAICRGLK